MGSNSRSNSNQTTNNTSTTFGIQGPNHGNIINGSGNNITDGGAFELVGNALEAFIREGGTILGQGFGAVTDLAMTAERQNENLLNTAESLFGDTNNAMQEMARLGAQVLTDTGEIMAGQTAEAFSFGRSALDTAADAMDSATSANRDVSLAAMNNSADLAAVVAGSLERANDNNTFLAGRSMDNSADLAENLSRVALDAGNDANKSAMLQLESGFKSMLGFAEQYSRSDGQALAESNNKTMLIAVGGLTATALAVALILRGRK